MTNCTDLAQKYSQLRRKYLEPLDDLQKILAENPEAVFTKLNHFATAGQEVDELLTQFQTQAREMLIKWMDPGRRDEFAQKIEFDGWRVIIKGNLMLNYLPDDEDDPHTFNYFPSIIRKVDGNLNLPWTIADITGLEEISGILDVDVPDQFHAPNLQKASRIYINAAGAHLPQLRTAESIKTRHVTNLEIPSLTEINRIEGKDILKMDVSNLETVSRDLVLDTIKELHAPKLRIIRDVHCPEAAIVELPHFEKAERLYAHQATDIILPEAQQLFELYAPNATEVDIRQLIHIVILEIPKAEVIHAPSLKWINKHCNIKGLKINFRQAFKSLESLGNVSRVSEVSVDVSSRVAAQINKLVANKEIGLTGLLGIDRTDEEINAELF